MTIILCKLLITLLCLLKSIIELSRVQRVQRKNTVAHHLLQQNKI